MLLMLNTALVEGLVLLLDASDFLLDFLGPVFSLNREALVGALFEFTNLINLSLFLDLKKSLLHSLGEKYVEDGLYLSVVIK